MRVSGRCGKRRINGEMQDETNIEFNGKEMKKKVYANEIRMKT